MRGRWVETSASVLVHANTNMVAVRATKHRRRIRPPHVIAWATLALIIVALFEARVGFAWPTEHLVSGIVDRDAFDEIAGGPGVGG